MRKTLSVALVALVVGTAARAAAATACAHLRYDSPAGRLLVAGALQHSPLVRSFLDELDQSDVIVYLDVATTPSGASYRGSMRLMAATPDARILLVQVDAWRASIARQVASFAHELWHVLEVARSPQVRCAGDLERLYLEIGRQWTRGRFETDGAIAAEEAVWNEVTLGTRHSKGVGSGQGPLS